MTLPSDDRGVLAPCPSCGKTNRLRYDALHRASRCGHCQTALPSPAAPIDVASEAAFDALVKDSAVPVVVDFWAPWCGPCRMMAPEVEKAAKSLAGTAVVVKVNTEAVSELGERFRIRSIPTLVVFRGGQEVTRSSGARPAAGIEAIVRQSTPAAP